MFEKKISKQRKASKYDGLTLEEYDELQRCHKTCGLVGGERNSLEITTSGDTIGEQPS